MQPLPFSGRRFSSRRPFLVTSDTSEFHGFSAWGPTGRVAIDKSATPSKVAPGGVVHYTLRVHNPNTYPAIATVTDDLADILEKGALHNVTSSHPTVTVDKAQRVLTWHGTLEKGETAVIRYSLTVDPNARGIITNRVLGPFSAFCSEGPPELPCETQTPIRVPKGPGADLSVTKIPSTHSAHPGAQVLYTLVVHNHGAANATGVTVQDSAPPSVFLQSATPSQGSPCTVTATDLTCRLGSIVSGGSATVLVEATLATTPSPTGAPTARPT